MEKAYLILIGCLMVLSAASLMDAAGINMRMKRQAFQLPPGWEQKVVSKY